MFSNEKTIEKEENIENFKALQKRFFMLGITFLIVAMGLYVLLHSLAENPHIIIEFFIFAFAISSVTLIFIGLVMPKDTNWFSLVGSTVFLFCCLLVLIFYPDQEFQQRLNIISLVTIIGTLLFGVFDVFINAVFFPSKNPEIRQSVDFVSNRFAVEVLTFTFIIGTVFGTIAYLFFVPNKDIALFFGGIDIKNVAIATAGLVTFFWGAKTAKNRSIELEEKKQDGKRRDKEIKMAEARDTAQLIAKASELLGSENDAQKYAGLAFLNRVASQTGGPLQKEAFDLLADFILSATDTTTSNKPRMRAISYANNLLEDRCRNFKLNEYVEISAVKTDKSNENYKFEQLNILYKEFNFSPQFPFLWANTENKKRIAYNHCTFKGFSGQKSYPMIDGIYAENCVFSHCKIGSIYAYSRDAIISDGQKGHIPQFSKYRFNYCDFSKCKCWELFWFAAFMINGGMEFNKCFYYKDQPPAVDNAKLYNKLLTEISSDEQFIELIGSSNFMYYMPPK